MKILFVHQNFPGQFLHLAPALSRRGHEVLALTAEANKRHSQVRVMRYRTPSDTPVKGLAKTYAEATERAASVARAAWQLTQQTGFSPDVVFGHGGWGETLFLRDVWPDARHLTYAEFYYHSTGLDTDFDPEFRAHSLPAQMNVTARAAHLGQSVLLADAALAPTRWQAETFPAELRPKITVIHDGIDTDRVCPDANASFELPNGRRLVAGDEVLSFVNRNLEPYRGYHIFMRSLPAVMEARPAAQVVIIGGDGQSYGPRPAGEVSWKQKFLDEVAGRIDPARVHFMGKVPYAQYLSLLQVTRVHAYLTYPFVLSWSMLEAMSAGALVIGSRTAPVEEVIKDGENGRLVDFFDSDAWSRALIDALEIPARADPLRLAARRTVQEKYDLKRHCLPRLIDFVETTGQVQTAAL